MPWTSSRPAGTNTAAVYRTPEHKRARAQLLAQHHDGDPCCLCGKPMVGPTRLLHADHNPGTNTYRGLAHAACNQTDGAKRGRARQDSSPLRW